MVTHCTSTTTSSTALVVIATATAGVVGCGIVGAVGHEPVVVIMVTATFVVMVI